MSKQLLSNQLQIIARAPFTVYYEGEARSISALNKVGQFEVLPGNADFFSMLLPGEVVIETDREPVKFTISSGIITVRDNEVMLFADM
jgi:F0F1-type ATP synthase epsilon subunit